MKKRTKAWIILVTIWWLPILVALFMVCVSVVQWVIDFIEENLEAIERTWLSGSKE